MSKTGGLEPDKKKTAASLRYLDFLLQVSSTLYLIGMMGLMIYVFIQGSVVHVRDALLPFEAFILLPLLVTYMIYICCRKIRGL